MFFEKKLVPPNLPTKCTCHVVQFYCIILRQETMSSIRNFHMVQYGHQARFLHVSPGVPPNTDNK